MQWVPCWDTEGIGKQIHGNMCYSCPVGCAGKTFDKMSGTCECFGCGGDSSTVKCNEVELTSDQLDEIHDRVP